MSWLNADLWWLLPLAAVPTLIHLLIRRRLPEVRWAAMTFLLRAYKRNKRKLLLETILLLLVRTLIVLAIVLVVLRPVVRASMSWLAGRKQRTTSVIVLDDSASMAASDGVRSRLDRAIGSIDQYLDELPGGSEVAVVLAAEPVKDLIRQPTRDLDYVRQILSTVEPRASRDALDQALELGMTILGEQAIENREIIVATDAQSLEKGDERAAVTGTLNNARQNATTILLPVPPTPIADVAVIGADVMGGPNGLIPDLACTAWPTEIHATVASLHHAETVERVVEFFVDQQKVGRREVQIPPNEQVSIIYRHLFTSPGNHIVTVRSSPDMYSSNNSHHLRVHARDTVSALLVDGRPDPDPAASATGFVKLALWPTDPRDETTEAFVQTRVVTSAELESLSTSAFELIILADVAALPTTTTARLRSTVRDGSALIVVAGPRTRPSAIENMFGQQTGGVLPVTLAEPIVRAPDEPPIRLQLADPIPAALSGFDDPALSEALAAVGWRFALPVASVNGDNAQVWARSADGAPAIVVNPVGEGMAIYLALPLDRESSDFPISPAFVPFVQQLAFHAVLKHDVSSKTAGDPLVWSTADEEATILLPDKTTMPASMVQTHAPGQSSERVTLPAADQAGVYRLRSHRNGTRIELPRAVNIYPFEIDPYMPQIETLQGMDQLKSVAILDHAESLKVGLRKTRAGAELSFVGLAVLLGLLALEMLLVKIFTPRQVDSDALLKKVTQL